MLVSRESAADRIQRRLTELLNDDVDAKRVARFVEDKYKLPSGEVMDYVSGRKDIANAGADIMFVIADGIDNICKKNLVEKIFTEIERREFGKLNLGPKKAKFPMTIRCFRVAPDQWIGSCDADFLVSLCNAQMINYNANTQRVLKHVITHGGNEYYKISVNKRAVSEIAKLLREGAFVPNTITLNIPEDEMNFTYDEASAELTIWSLKMFDILDGYHRLLAILMVKSENKDFNAKFELRIANFNETKARQFIYQEDQKTKMRKIDSESMNTFSPANRVTEMLNDDMLFINRGRINRSDGVINSSELASLINYFYFKSSNTTNLPKSEEGKQILETKRVLCGKFNALYDANLDLIDRRLSFKELAVVIYSFYHFGDTREAIDHIGRGLSRASEINYKYTNPRKSLIKEIESII